MLQMYGFDGGTPTHRAHGGLTAADPSVFGVGGDAVDLTVLPRWTEYGAARAARRHAWYDLIWTTPADRIFLDHRTYAHSSPAGLQYPDLVMEEAIWPRGRLAEILLRRALGQAGVLPAPEVIPFEERLEAAGPVTLEGVPEAHITLWGGPEKALKLLQRRRAIAVKNDRTVDVYDWDAWGRTAAEAIRALLVPEVA